MDNGVKNPVDQELVVMPYAENSIDQMVDIAEKNLEKLNKIVGIALKRTSPQDWVNIGGKPYLGASGAEKVRGLFGISITDVHNTKTIEKDEKGEYYMFTCTGTACLPDGKAPVVFLGVCTSRDQFFSMAHGAMKADSEIDISNISKSAYTNMTTNAVTRLLGLRNLSWDQVKSAGITQDNTAKVEHTSYKAEVEPEKLKALGELLLKLVDGDKTKAVDLLEKYTSFKGKDGEMVKGKRELKFVSAGQYAVILKKAQEDLKDKEHLESAK